MQNMLPKQFFLRAILLELQMARTSQPKHFIQGNMPYDCCRHTRQENYSVIRAGPVNFCKQGQRVIDESSGRLTQNFIEWYGKIFCTHI